MEIEPRQVEHIAGLSMLRITEEERDSLGIQLGKVLDYIEKLNELYTADVEPTSHVLELTNVVREDALRPSLKADEALANAPDRAEDFYRVPKIIE